MHILQISHFNGDTEKLFSRERGWILSHLYYGLTFIILSQVSQWGRGGTQPMGGNPRVTPSAPLPSVHPWTLKTLNCCQVYKFKHILQIISPIWIMTCLTQPNFVYSACVHLQIFFFFLQGIIAINKAIETHAFHTKPTLLQAFENAKSGGRLHFLGLVSDGGVHSHIAHLEAFLDAARMAGVGNAFVHFFSDGRDTSPVSGGL